MIMIMINDHPMEEWLVHYQNKDCSSEFDNCYRYLFRTTINSQFPFLCFFFLILNINKWTDQLYSYSVYNYCVEISSLLFESSFSFLMALKLTNNY